MLMTRTKPRWVVATVARPSVERCRHLKLEARDVDDTEELQAVFAAMRLQNPIDTPES